MSTDQELFNPAGTEPEGQTLFDELAGLVPAERQAEYYRVIAHTRTLSPNDEMLRVLEAMGILALLTREAPAEIAAERKSLRKILESALSQADKVEKRIAGYILQLESRIAQLPKELQEGLDPPRIGKLLGESLRQCFQQSGMSETAGMLGQSCSEMQAVQKRLVNVLNEVAHPEGGVIAKVLSANESLLRSMATRAQQIHDLLGRLEKQVWAIWLPVVASAALALGFFLGAWFASERQTTPETPSMDQTIIERLNAPVKANDILLFSSGISVSEARRGSWSTVGRFAARRSLRCPEISVNGQPIVLCHYAMRVSNRSHHGAWHLYGHSHGNLPEGPTSLSMDVGIPMTFARGISTKSAGC